MERWVFKKLFDDFITIVSNKVVRNAVLLDSAERGIDLGIPCKLTPKSLLLFIQQS